uniref:Uncharacterized protein n=1 Tax=Mustela putorius furo TaxID=9669 RepID=M3XZ55_MUSPF
MPWGPPDLSLLPSVCLAPIPLQRQPQSSSQLHREVSPRITLSTSTRFFWSLLHSHVKMEVLTTAHRFLEMSETIYWNMKRSKKMATWHSQATMLPHWKPVTFMLRERTW